VKNISQSNRSLSPTSCLFCTFAPLTTPLFLFHMAMTYLGIPQSHQKILPNPPTQNRHLLLPWLPCFQGNSKTEKQCVSRVTNTFDMCVFTSVDAQVFTHTHKHSHICMFHSLSAFPEPSHLNTWTLALKPS